MARIDQIAPTSPVIRFGVMEPVDTPVARVDEIPDNSAGASGNGVFNKTGKNPTVQSVELWFGLKPAYWAYVAVGMLVLYTLFKK